MQFSTHFVASFTRNKAPNIKQKTSFMDEKEWLMEN